MKAIVIYDLATHSYTLKRNIIGNLTTNEDCVEITHEQWLKHERVRREFLDIQVWILEVQAKRSEEWETEQREEAITNCKTCKKPFDNGVCLVCSEDFFTCDCTINICLYCMEDIYSEPAKHRFNIALLALLECAPHAFDENLGEYEIEARDRLIKLCHKISKETEER